MDKLLSFLNMKTDLNPVLIGYFCNVLKTIIENRKLMFWEYIMNNKDCIERLLYYSDNESIAEVLAKLLKEDNYEKISSTISNQRKCLINRLLDNPNKGWVTIEFIISFQTCIQYLSVNENIKKIYETIINLPQTFQLGLKLIIGLLDSIKLAKAPKSGFELVKSSDQANKYSPSSIIKYSINYSIFFKEKLLNQSSVQVVISIIDFLGALVCFKNEKIINKLLKDNFISVFLELFNRYPNHSILHIRIQNIIKEILNSEYIQTIEDCILGIPERLLSLYYNGKKGFEFTKEKQLNKPYTIFVTQLCWIIKELALRSNKIHDYLISITGWKDFVEGDLTEIHYRENTMLICKMDHEFYSQEVIRTNIIEDYKEDLYLCDREEFIHYEESDDEDKEEIVKRKPFESNQIIEKRVKYEEDECEQSKYITIPHMINTDSALY